MKKNLLALSLFLLALSLSQTSLGGETKDPQSSFPPSVLDARAFRSVDVITTTRGNPLLAQNEKLYIGYYRTADKKTEFSISIALIEGRHWTKERWLSEAKSFFRGAIAETVDVQGYPVVMLSEQRGHGICVLDSYYIAVYEHENTPKKYILAALSEVMVKVGSGSAKKEAEAAAADTIENYLLKCEDLPAGWTILGREDNLMSVIIEEAGRNGLSAAEVHNLYTDCGYLAGCEQRLSRPDPARGIGVAVFARFELFQSERGAQKRLEEMTEKIAGTLRRAGNDITTQKTSDYGHAGILMRHGMTTILFFRMKSVVYTLFPDEDNARVLAQIINRRRSGGGWALPKAKPQAAVSAPKKSQPPTVTKPAPAQKPKAGQPAAPPIESKAKLHLEILKSTLSLKPGEMQEINDILRVDNQGNAAANEVMLDLRQAINQIAEVSLCDYLYIGDIPAGRSANPKNKIYVVAKNSGETELVFQAVCANGQSSEKEKLKVLVEVPKTKSAAELPVKIRQDGEEVKEVVVQDIPSSVEKGLANKRITGRGYAKKDNEARFEIFMKKGVQASGKGRLAYVNTPIVVEITVRTGSKPLAFLFLPLRIEDVTDLRNPKPSEAQVEEGVWEFTTGWRRLKTIFVKGAILTGKALAQAASGVKPKVDFWIPANEEVKLVDTIIPKSPGTLKISWDCPYTFNQDEYYAGQGYEGYAHFQGEMDVDVIKEEFGIK